jgi:hypothetical protein
MFRFSIHALEPAHMLTNQSRAWFNCKELGIPLCKKIDQQCEACLWSLSLKLACLTIPRAALCDPSVLTVQNTEYSTYPSPSDPCNHPTIRQDPSGQR